MNKYKLIQKDYYFGTNHKLYTDTEIILGTIHRDKEFLQVPIMVNCYSCDNTLELFYDYIPLDIIERVGE